MSGALFASLFSGAGGLDIGMEAAGWDCVYASDIDGAAVETLVANGFDHGCKNAFGRAHLEQADVRALKGREILAKGAIRRGDLPLLVGGPPCQSWSSAGHQLGFNDPRGRLFDDFIRLAGELDVRWLLFENVRGLLTARGPDGRPGGALELIRAQLLRAGFQTHVALLNAADYGVPQRRVRLFVFGYRAGDALPFPEPTHHKAGAENLGFAQPWVSMKEAFAGLSPVQEDEIIRPRGKMAEQLEGLRPGSGVKSPGKCESTRPGGHWGYKQGAFIADLSVPARTVTASAQQDWIIDPALGLRRLCPRECAALQTFPPNWRFAGARADQYRLIGNAVPPLLAGRVGQSLLRHLHAAPAPASVRSSSLAPLSPRLAAAIHYTLREEMRNGASRREAPQKRRPKIAQTDALQAAE
jgi:DNA (cytosine-5)-methyltransferase 1